MGHLYRVQKRLNEIRDNYKNAKKGGIKYKAAKGDETDMMLANWINAHGCMIPIERLGGGYYMFGTRKIFANIFNGKLVIRVGGGYMGIDEFMKHYGQQEIDKMRRLGMLDGDGSMPRSPSELKGNERVMGSASFKKQLRASAATPRSPGSKGSPTAGRSA